MTEEQLSKRIDYLIGLGEKAIDTKKFVQLTGHVVDSHLHVGFRTASLSFIRLLYGEKHIYYVDFEKNTKRNLIQNAKQGISILESVRDEIHNGWLHSVKRLVSAEIFSDFLEMSQYLLSEGYKDAAAVMIGSVLEEHLRLLCKKNSIETNFTNKRGVEINKKADAINAELAKANVYGILEQKNVTAWLDLRNKAAHGKYDEYTPEHVQMLYMGVLNFVSQVQ